MRKVPKSCRHRQGRCQVLVPYERFLNSEPERNVHWKLHVSQEKDSCPNVPSPKAYRELRLSDVGIAQTLKNGRFNATYSHALSSNLQRPQSPTVPASYSIHSHRTTVTNSRHHPPMPVTSATGRRPTGALMTDRLGNMERVGPPD